MQYLKEYLYYLKRLLIPFVFLATYLCKAVLASYTLAKTTYCNIYTADRRIHLLSVNPDIFFEIVKKFFLSKKKATLHEFNFVLEDMFLIQYVIDVNM